MVLLVYFGLTQCRQPRVIVVMITHLLEPSEFVAVVQPLLARQDANGLREVLRARWTTDQIKAILHSDNTDARKVACLALALIGRKCAIPCVAEQLKDPDEVVNQMAEHALLSIWLRAGTEDANAALWRGMRALDRRDIECAMKHFTKAIDLDPTFAEAYNQRAIAKYLGERYDESIEDCLEAIERMPCHFLAWSGMGHCHAHSGRMKDAVRCYERAIAINPHLEAVREALRELKRDRREV